MRNAIGRRGIIGWALAALIVMGAGAHSARAGTWMQISCVNPDGSAAPAEGWTLTTPSPADPGGIASTQCSPGTPMLAELSALAAAPPNSAENLSYQPPAGSTLLGGSLNVAMSAQGYGNDSTGQASAVAVAGLYEPSLATPFFRCVAFFQTCGPSPNFSGVVSLPNDAQGTLTAGASCSSDTGTPCDANASDSAWALMQVAWAHLLLSSSVSPTGSAVSGSALQPGVRGTAHVVLSAAETAGPGIYSDSVAIDGRTVFTGTPNTDGGKCVPVGTDAASGALMFDYQQPCLTSEVIDAPVPTADVPDGRHDLSVEVTDAAGNSSTVLDQTISTSNPQTTPNPSGRRAIHARFTISWRWDGATTTLRSIGVEHLPRAARVAVRCTGERCPRVRAAATGPRRVATMLHRLAGRRLRAGQTLLITVTQPRHVAERIVLGINDGRKPTARLRKR